MQTICAQIDETGGFADPTPLGPIVGRVRPEDRRVRCPARYAVSGASVSRSDDHPYLVAIDLSCTELVSRNDGWNHFVAQWPDFGPLAAAFFKDNLGGPEDGPGSTASGLNSRGDDSR